MNGKSRPLLRWWVAGVIAFPAGVIGCRTLTPEPTSPAVRETATDGGLAADRAESAIRQIDFTDGASADVGLAARLRAENQFDAPEIVSAGLDEDFTVMRLPPVAPGLTLASLESIATTSHPSIAAARARVDAAIGQTAQAGLPFNPVLQYQSEEVGNDDSSGLHSVTMSQQLVTADKLALAQQVQSQLVARQRAELRLAELQILTRVRTAFAAALVAQRRVELTEQINRLAESSVSAVQALVDAGEASKIELLQAKLEQQQSLIQSENAATQLNATRRSLAAAAGITQLPDGPIEGDLSAAWARPPWESGSPWQVSLAEITAASPEIAAADSELDRARWALRLACAQVTPNVTGQLGVGVDTASDDTFAVFGISVPLPIRNRNEGNIRSARAEIAAATAAIDATRYDLANRLADAIGRYEVARQRAGRLSETVIPNAEQTFELSREAFEAGETNFLQLLTAQRSLFTAQLTALEAAAVARSTMAEIDGLLVPTGR